MKLAEERHIAAEPATVWAAVLNLDVMKQFVPGCQSVTGCATEGDEAVLAQKVGPAKERFVEKVTLSDMVAGKSLWISVEGQGGLAGYAKDAAEVTMARAVGHGTTLTHDEDASVGGKLAKLCSLVIDGFARNNGRAVFRQVSRCHRGIG